MSFFKFALIITSILSAVCGYTVYRTSLDFYEIGVNPGALSVKLTDKTDDFYKIVRAEIIKSGVDDSFDANLKVYEKMFAGVLTNQDIKNVFDICKKNTSCVGPSTNLLRQASEKKNTVKEFDSIVMKRLATKFNSESISGPNIDYKVVSENGEVKYVAKNMEQIRDNLQNISKISRQRALEDAQWYALISSMTLLLFTVLMFRRK